MLTTISFVMLALIAWIAHSGTKRDRRFYDLGSDENIREVTLHIQQDLKLVAFLLAGILVMLGILGDILSRH
jgi:ribose/xylose/arabinose/galactoside ABC-type transport system permease subunit